MIIFDFDGVVSDSVRWFDDVAAQVSSIHDVDGDALLDWMIGQSRDWLTGAWSDDRFIEELNTSFALTVTIAEIVTACRRSMRIDPHVRGIIERLGTIAIFTDNPQVRASVITEAVPNAHVTCSQRVGKRKHDPEGFERFAQMSGITSGLFIDDYPPNIEAARRAGFDAVRWQLGKDPYEALEATVEEYLRSAEEPR
jgi:FMN phosphatase YigB (HAD superfamily)